MSSQQVALSPTAASDQVTALAGQLAAASLSSVTQRTEAAAQAPIQAATSTPLASKKLGLVPTTLGSEVQNLCTLAGSIASKACPEEAEKLADIRKNLAQAQLGLIQMLHGRLNTFRQVKSEAALKLEAAKTRFEAIMPTIREAHTQLYNAKSEAERAPLKEKYSAMATTWKALYDELQPLGALCFKVEAECEAIMKTNREIAPPLTKAERDAIIDPAVAQKADELLAAHRQAIDDNEGLAFELKGICEAISLYFYLLATVLAYLLFGTLIELPAIATNLIGKAVNWAASWVTSKKSPYNDQLKHPYNGKEPPAFAFLPPKK